MSTTTPSPTHPGLGGLARGLAARVAALAIRVAGWPVRVHRARQLTERLARMSDHELGDVGLTRQDLCDSLAGAFDADPSLILRQRAAERRRGRPGGR